MTVTEPKTKKFKSDIEKNNLEALVCYWWGEMFKGKYLEVWAFGCMSGVQSSMMCIGKTSLSDEFTFLINVGDNR